MINPNYGISPYLVHKGATLNPFANASFLMDQFDFTQKKLLDKSGNDNHFDLGNSYCVNPTGATGAAVLKTTITIDLTIHFIFTFEYFKTANEVSGIIFGGGHTLQDYVYITNTGALFGNYVSGNITFTFSSVLAAWNRVTVVGDGTNITFTNITANSSNTQSRGTATTMDITSLLGRNGGTVSFKHPVRFIDINNVSEYHFSEYPTNTTYASKFYDAIGYNHATALSNHVTVKSDDKYFWNLKNGYSIWENGAGGIVWVPYGNDGNPLTLTVGTDIATGYAKTYDCPANLTYHNYCETGIKAPIELLPYDVDNYLFDTSDVPIELLPEMIAENVGNKIFCNKSQVNKYFDLVVFEEEQL